MMTRQMKSSGVEWIGDIPEKWKINKIKHFFKVLGGATPKSDEESFWDGGIVWITPADIYENQNEIKDSLRKITQSGLKSCGAHLLPADSIIVSTRAPIGLIAISKVELCTNQGCKSLVPQGNVFSKYLLYYLTTQAKVLNEFGRGTTFLELSSFSLSNFKFPYPPLSEQKAIADYLDAKCAKIDTFIAKQKAVIEKLKEYKQSVITEAVTKGLNPAAPLKSSGVDWIGDIPEKWEVQRLKTLLSKPLQYGANATGVEYNKNLPRYIRITDISNDNKLRENDPQSLPLDIATPFLLEDGDILFARSGATVGKTFQFKMCYGKAAFAGYLIRAQLKNKISSSFVYYYTLSFAYDEWKNRIFIQSTIQNIGANKYSNLEIPYPPLSEQKAIADYLDDRCGKIDDFIAKKQTVIDKLTEYKKSLIYECVTGKRDVA